MTRIAVVLLAALASLPAGVARAQTAPAQAVLTISSSWPKNTPWANLLERAARDIDTTTSGRVQVKVTISRDERAVVGRLQQGQLDGAVLTTVGLGIVQPAALVFQIPMLFRDASELDSAQAATMATFHALFAQSGLELLTWTDGMPVHLYADVPLSSPADVAGRSAWLDVADAMQTDFFTRLGVAGVSLPIVDVLQALQNRTVAACSGTLLNGLALEWDTQVKTVTESPLWYEAGAIVLTNAVFAQISPSDQRIVLAIAAQLGADLRTQARATNAKVLKVMTAQGIRVVAIPPALAAVFEHTGQAVAAQFAGTLYPAQVYQDIVAHLVAIRAQPGAAGAGGSGAGAKLTP